MALTVMSLLRKDDNAVTTAEFDSKVALVGKPTSRQYDKDSVTLQQCESQMVPMFGSQIAPTVSCKSMMAAGSTVTVFWRIFWTLLMAVAHAQGESLNGEDEEEASGILELTDANFHQVVGSNPWVIVMFYAPWCGHCKALAPEYVSAAKQLSSPIGGGASGTPPLPQIIFAGMDATTEIKTAAFHGVQGYPMLKLFHSSNTTSAEDQLGSSPQVTDYRGARNAAALVKWLKRKTGPATPIMTSKEQLESILASTSVVIVGFFDSDDDDSAEAVNIFKTLAAEDEEHHYVIGRGDELRANYKAAAGDILLIKTFDSGRARLEESPLTKAALERFVSLEGRPLLFEFGPQTVQAIFGAGIHRHLLYLGRTSDPLHGNRCDMLRRVAADYREQIIFMHVNVDVAEHANILQFLGVPESDCPTFVIIELEKSAKFFADRKELTEENVRHHVDNYLAGNLKRKRLVAKTQPVQPDWDSQPVKVLVAENFEEIVMDPNKDVFVEFYAPWCGHCKSLEPVWEQLGKQFAHRSDKLVAKIDATQNQLESVAISGYPTLRLFTKTSNNMVEYAGKRTLEELAEFLETGGISTPTKDEL